jgi:Concanavalin A-like lectin/glucanases superfamily
VATKSGETPKLYVDGVQIHSGADAASDAAVQPWHVMRNGSNTVYSEGEADEIALYTRALAADEVRAHHDLARALASAPLPAETSAPVDEPPAAGTGAGGGVLRASRPPSGTAGVRRGVLTVRGAPNTPNRLTARRRGPAWRITDAAAPLRAGAGCRRVGPRAVRCRATGVRRIEMYGGAGADRLTLVGAVRALLDGGPGADRLVGGPRTRFHGGPGADLVRRRRAAR